VNSPLAISARPEATMRTKYWIVIVILLCTAPALYSQELQVTKENKSVEVTVTQKVEVEADIARVTLEAKTFGQTHETAYEENLRIADQVIKSILNGGISKERIETHGLKSETQSSDDLKEFAMEERKFHKFTVVQSWSVRVSTNDAQRVVDLAVRAGANRIVGVEWEVNDPDALDAKARRASVEKARVVAEEIAGGLGGKLGAILFVSNASESKLLYVPRAGLSEDTTKQRFTEQFWERRSLQLFPEKITREATVHAIFALQ
jgi:uncharacterized protein YggE